MLFITCELCMQIYDSKLMEKITHNNDVITEKSYVYVQN